ncbi:hypothetical protein KI387_030923, partial [Taxus chinensis]
MATLGVSAGLVWRTNLLSRKSDYSRERIGKGLCMPSKLGYQRKKPTTVKANNDDIPNDSCEKNRREGRKFKGLIMPDTVLSNYDHNPKDSREENLEGGGASKGLIMPGAVKAKSDHNPKKSMKKNLKEEVKENFKNVPECDYGLPPKQLEMFMTGNSSFKCQAEKAIPESLSSSKYFVGYNSSQIYGKMMNNSSQMYGKMMNSGVNAGIILSRGSEEDLEEDSEEDSEEDLEEYWEEDLEEYSEEYSYYMNPPPDLPSLLLYHRILWIDIPLYTEVTELIIAQLYWLDYDDPTEPIYLYIDSTGTQDRYGRAVSLEYDAFAIADVLNHLSCKIYTLNISRAFGQAGMLLSLGTKGCRYSLPGAAVKLFMPKALPEGGQSTDMWIRANELESETNTYLKFLAQGTGKSKEEIAKDLTKGKVLSVPEAIKYGIVDKVMKSGNNKSKKTK